MAEIANLFLDAGQMDRFAEWVGRAILDSAGRKAVQDCLRAYRHNQQRVDVQQILGCPPAANTTEGNPGLSKPAVSDEDIRLTAWFKWETAERPEGDGVSFWLEAEKVLRASGLSFS